MEDMGNDPARESGLCGHPPLNTPRQHADRDGDGPVRGAPQPVRLLPLDHRRQLLLRAARRAAHAAAGRPREGAQHARTSTSSRRTSATTATTSRARTASPGGLVSADAWLREWVPRITGSPAFKRDGLLLITFDEAEAEGGDRRRERLLQPGAVPEHAEQRRAHAGPRRRARRRRGAVAVHPAGNRDAATRTTTSRRCARCEGLLRPSLPGLRRLARPGQLRRGRLYGRAVAESARLRGCPHEDRAGLECMDPHLHGGYAAMKVGVITGTGTYALPGLEARRAGAGRDPVRRGARDARARSARWRCCTSPATARATRGSRTT